jgi:hypothetical protein
MFWEGQSLMSVDSSAPRSRRAVLAAALGGLGAVVVSRFATPEAVKAANDDPVTVGHPFTGTAETSITVTGAANAIVGSSDTGTGLRGSSTSTSAVVDPTVIAHATGVIGTAGDTTNMAGNTGETGVYGFSDITPGSNGVWGDSVTGTGVYGSGDTGVVGFGGYVGVYAVGSVAIWGDASAFDTGVYGFAGSTVAPLPPAGVGVQASATAGLIALNVTGKAKFSRSGRTYFAATKYSKKVPMVGVTASSYVIATLQSKRSGIYVQSVVPALGYFTIYLNKAVSSKTYVGYLVIN